MVRRLLATALVMTACVVTACSLIVTGDAYQCRTTADCARLSRPGCHGFLTCGPDHICSPNAMVCCDTNAECSDAFLQPYICRKTDHQCARVASSDCPSILGADALYDLRAPVVLGTTSSALDLALVPPLATQTGTLFVGHTADSARLDGLTVATDAGPRLYYRTAASERQPLALLAQSITDYVEPVLRAPGGPLAGGGEMSVLAVLRSDPSSGARELLGQILHVRYASVAYTDVTDGVEAVLATKPHVLILDGGDEITRELIPRLEAGWTEPRYRPRVLIAGGRGKTPLFAAAIGHDEDRRKRTFGFTAGPLGPLRAGLGDVVAAQGYDATWVAYYALALRDRAAPGSAPWSLEKLLPGPGRPTVELGPTTLASGLPLLDVGLDLQGATGPLDFDPATGTPEQDVDMWYLGADGSFVSTGYQYSAAQKRIIGTPVVR